MGEIFKDRPQDKFIPVGAARQQRRVIMMFITLLIVILGIFAIMLGPSGPSPKEFGITASAVIAAHNQMMTATAIADPAQVNCPYNPSYIADGDFELVRLREAGLNISAFVKELPCGSEFPKVANLILILPVRSTAARFDLGNAARNALHALSEGNYEDGDYTVSLIFTTPGTQPNLWRIPLPQAIELLSEDVGPESLFEMLEGIAEDIR